jgi:hypothetical protein
VSWYKGMGFREMSRPGAAARRTGLQGRAVHPGREGPRIAGRGEQAAAALPPVRRLRRGGQTPQGRVVREDRQGAGRVGVAAGGGRPRRRAAGGGAGGGRAAGLEAVGAVVEVEHGSEWWDVDVVGVSGQRVRIHYVGGDDCDVRARPPPIAPFPLLVLPSCTRSLRFGGDALQHATARTLPPTQPGRLAR